MVPEQTVRSSVRSVFHRPASAIQRIGAGSLMAIVTAAGFLPLFPTTGAAISIDPTTLQWLGNVGMNLLAGWIQQFWQHTSQSRPADSENLLNRLSSALATDLAGSAALRSEVGRFLDLTGALDAARGALEGREADQAWFLVTIYMEMLGQRGEHASRLSEIEASLEVLGYKADILLRNASRIKEIQFTLPEADQQIHTFEAELKLVPLWPPGLPSGEPYYSLPQRDADVRAVLDVLRDPAGRRLIAIDGLGGMGKTSIAVEIGRRCLRESLFERVLGESAKRERIVGGVVEEIPQAPARLGSDDLLDAIARQLGRWDVPTMQPQAKRQTLQALLRGTRCLIIADNLEMADDARNIALELSALLTDSRAIVTSRPRLGLDLAHTLSLDGLDVLDSLVFLREEARSTNRTAILKAPDDRLLEVHAATGGAPLAMKLVVGQAGLLPFSEVLRNLSRAQGDIYPFIFLESWKLLSEQAQKLLLYMGTAVTACPYEELTDVGIAEDEAGLQRAIREATDLSLLRPQPSRYEMLYDVHPLTRHFVNNDLPEIWKQQGLL